MWLVTLSGFQKKKLNSSNLYVTIHYHGINILLINKKRDINLIIYDFLKNQQFLLELPVPLI